MKSICSLRWLLLIGYFLLNGSCYNKPATTGEAAATGEAASNLFPDGEIDDEFSSFESEEQFEGDDREVWSEVGATNPSPNPGAADRPSARRRAPISQNELTGPRLSSRFRTSNDTDYQTASYNIGRWERDPRKAMELARETRRLLLIWMENSKVSNKALPTEVFNHPSFLALEKDELVLTRVDYGDPRIAGSEYGEKLRNALKTRGFPALYLFSPDGDQLEALGGYRKNSFPLVIGTLQEHVKNHHLKEAHWDKKLASEGFRNWHNYEGKPVFAKVTAVSKEEKTVTLEDRYEKQFIYPIVNLSDADRSYLSDKLSEAARTTSTDG